MLEKNRNWQFSVVQEELVGQKPGNTEELLKQSQQELLWLQRQLCIRAADAAGPWAAGKVSSPGIPKAFV